MLRITISSHENHNFSLEQSLTAFGGAPFAQGSLGPYQVFGLFDKSELEWLLAGNDLTYYNRKKCKIQGKYFLTNHGRYNIIPTK